MLFALYLVDCGRALEATGEGFLLADVRIPALLFADDLLLCAATPEGLRRLLDVCEEEMRKLELTISQKKSMIISKKEGIWSLHDEEGEVSGSLDLVEVYKYLGVEVYNTMFRVSSHKQKKCILTARRYRDATRYLSRQGPDIVDLSICAWSRQAVPAIMYGVENIIFAESNIEALERIQGSWARNTLNLPSACPGVVAQMLLGVPSIKQIIFTTQLKYFLRLTQMPSSRYAAQALLEHETGGWRSPYLANMARIQVDMGLLQLPPAPECIDKRVEAVFRERLKIKVQSLSSIPVFWRDVKRRRAATAREGEDWRWVNRAIMGASGVQLDRESGVWRKRCPEEGAVFTELHCVSECAATAQIRRQTGISLYFTSCAVKGLTSKQAYSNFVMGLDSSGEEIEVEDYRDRGRTLGVIFKSIMGDNWGWFISSHNFESLERLV